MGAGEFNAGGNPGMDWHPIWGGLEILLVPFVPQNPELNASLMCHLARMQTLPTSKGSSTKEMNAYVF